MMGLYFEMSEQLQTHGVVEVVEVEEQQMRDTCHESGNTHPKRADVDENG